MPLIAAIKTNGTAPEDAWLAGEYATQAQAALCQEIALDMGGLGLGLLFGGVPRWLGVDGGRGAPRRLWWGVWHLVGAPGLDALARGSCQWRLRFQAGGREPSRPHTRGPAPSPPFALNVPAATARLRPRERPPGRFGPPLHRRRTPHRRSHDDALQGPRPDRGADG